MGYHFDLDSRVSTVHPDYAETEIALRIDDALWRASISPGEEPGEAILELDGQAERVWLASMGDVHFVHFRGRAHRVEAINALERARRAAAPTGGEEILRAPMPGVVVEVLVGAGAEVTQGELLMTIESMKLETAISAPHDATVAEVYVSAGGSFDQDGALLRLESEEHDPAQEENAK